ncbi:hypothetical protein D5R40_25420 [Okeania hirsuta]|uniref:Uncharacterized protein n=1 Tax=Okeania hirsuta TaxID=1458930 RepID=A0A3N6QA08_9CYAN|nr:hypothetical protein D5R40_25420 [Okeania hirsuta]
MPEELRKILIGIFGIADSRYDLRILYLGFCVLDGFSYLLILTVPYSLLFSISKNWSDSC